MRVEEEMILPAAEDLLTPSDWVELDAAFLEQQDPLANGKRDRIYDALFDRIVLTAPSPIGLGDGPVGPAS
jgi:hypothetical protein